jgi:hypothetical protein
MMEAVRTSETSVDNHFTRQYNPEDSSEHHTRRRENLKSHTETTAEEVISQFLIPSEMEVFKTDLLPSVYSIVTSCLLLESHK